MASDDLPPFLKTNPPPIAPPSTARLNALYASTSSQRTTNPTGYNANSQWWSSVIEETLRTGWINGEHGDRLILKVDDGLLNRLEDQLGRRPKGIGGVIQGLADANPSTLHPLPTYLSSLIPTHAGPSLTSRFIGKPLWWAMSQLNPFGSSSEKVDKEETLWSRYGKGKEYVHIPLLEQSASAFTGHLSKNPILSYTDALYDLEAFREQYSEVCFPSISSSKKLPAGTHKLSVRDIEVLVKWLHRDCGVIVTDGLVVKVLDADQIASDHPISEADRGVISVINAQRKVEKQIIGIEEQITQSQEKAKKQLAKGQKTAALSYLRSKKQLEDLLTKRIASSEQLGAVIRSIDQAKGDVEIMAAYETSTSTLRSVLSHPSLSPDKISATTDALAEAMADQEEIDQAVRIGGELATGSKRVEVDEDDLAAELAELVEEEKAAQAEARAAEEAKAKAAEEANREMERQDAKKAAEEARQQHQGSSFLAEGHPGIQQSDSESRISIDLESIDKTDEEWRNRYEDAQHRKEAEARRSQDEQLRKEERRIAAE
ncbi:uncharacterized protein I303_102319 [Kwoniella dejecticola CBS 10117]|uniref:Charged multivesicular body protein 7 n=1 Tax=Kwoniella dejecticola CBS 10117 TaxID=1296121 RepID=A0A1A6ABB2_9TREE|nr:charged multivesicular body protein 7 [Kwoniella dejecticola CBS 10117]OBR87338.1 charged multivesicular body protein 7 [Kwoniella dejecticola CBS 10117]